MEIKSLIGNQSLDPNMKNPRIFNKYGFSEHNKTFLLCTFLAAGCGCITNTRLWLLLFMSYSAGNLKTFFDWQKIMVCLQPLFMCQKCRLLLALIIFSSLCIINISSCSNIIVIVWMISWDWYFTSIVLPHSITLPNILVRTGWWGQLKNKVHC